jgi:hypothetical protein
LIRLGSRVYVHSSIYEEFLEKLVKEAKNWDSKIGDPFKDGVEGGPLVWIFDFPVSSYFRALLLGFSRSKRQSMGLY